MRTMLRGKVTLLFMTLGLLLAVPAVALADIIAVDSDTVATNIQGSRDLGNVAAGATVSPKPAVDFYLQCNGSNHLNASQTNNVTFNTSSIARSGGGAFTGGSATATDSSVTAPATGWPTDGINCNQAGDPAPVKGGSSEVTITAPSTPGTYTYTIDYNNSVDSPDITGNPQATFTLTVPSNTPPTAVNDSYNATEDTQLSVAAPGVLGNDTDPDANTTLNAVLVSGHSTAAANGFTLNANGSFSYTPAANFNGQDTFTYKANDGTADSNSAATVSINVAPVDDPPVAVNDAATVQEDAVATAINVLANDTDIDSGPKTISSASDSANGTVVLTGGTTGAHTGLTYKPDADYCNDPPATNLDTFTYTLNGGSQATVSMTVTCVNDAPTTPGAITSTESVNKDGTFRLDWGASTDVDSANITYTLEQKDNDDANWSEVASGLTSASYTFGASNARDEGTWDYQVKAVDDFSPPASSAYREALDLVKVDKSNPNAPTLSFATTGQSPKVTVNSVDWYKDSALINVADNGDPALSDTSAGSGVDADSFLASFSVNTNGNSTASKTVKDRATNESAAGTLEVNVDAANPTLGDCPGPASFLVNSGSGTPTTQSVGPINANDGESGIDSATSELTKSVNTSTTGTKTVTFKAQDRVGHSVTKNCDYVVRAYDFIGFSSPVDNPNYLNVLKAGQAIPLKWRLMDNGSPVTNLASVTVKVQSLNCSLGTTADQLEEVAAGGSSLQNLGDGYYQFNWKSPTSYANSCKTLTVSGVGVEKSAYFKFTK